MSKQVKINRTDIEKFFETKEQQSEVIVDLYKLVIINIGGFN